MIPTDLKTGDLILFNNKSGGILGCFTSLIEYFTHSDYSHVAMVIKNPDFIHPSLKGTYIWESSYEGKPDPQDGKIKLGVQITPLHEALNNYNGYVFLRRINCHRDTFNNKILSEIHEIVYNKPYDIVPKDWIEAIFRKDDNPQKISRFWCSALIGFIYTKCGILKNETDWSILRPSDFSLDGENLDFINGYSLENVQERIV